MPATKQILIVVTSHNRLADGTATGIWLEEFAIPYLEFTTQGCEVVVTSPQGGDVPIDPRSAPSSEAADRWGLARAALRKTQPLTAVVATPYAAIFLPGGHGTMFDLPGNATLQRLLGDFAAADKVIAAVCHGPVGLVGATLADGTPLVAGKRLTAFTDAEERAANLADQMPFLLESRLRELGAAFVAAPNWTDHSEQDGRLITGQNPQSSRSVARAILAALAD